MKLLVITLGLIILYRLYKYTLMYLHILQLESYENDRYLKYVRENKFIDARTFLFLSLIILLVAFFIGSFHESLSFLKIASIWILLIVFLILSNIKEANPLKKGDVIKPLVLTPRATRILVMNILLHSVIMGVFLFYYEFSGAGPWSLCSFLGFSVVNASQVISNPYLLNLSSLSVFHLWERHAQNRYKSDAKGILSRINPVIIAITGSYGKTSTKHITHQLLSLRLPVLATPASYNTEMGICKTIRESLQPYHKYFIVEMGAYRIGSIERLCDFTHPEIGILTSIGVSHLERFGSQENVLKAKSELLRSLPKDGLAIVNGDDDLCRKAVEVCEAPVRFFGLDGSKDDLVSSASNLRYTQDGMTFDLKIGEHLVDGVISPLLGEHNLLNILAAVVCADHLGIKPEVIKRGISQLKPIPHRMAISKEPSGITIIDDSYNSNPRGFESALKILKEFPGRKILVTPGIVELADVSDAIHRKLSELILETCDIVYIIKNPNSLVLGKALKEMEDKLEALRFFPDLKSARAELSKILTMGDIVLFENDLPDIYFRRRGR